MAKLADITFETRIILKILAALGVIVVLLFLIFKGSEFVIKQYFTPVPPPEMAFGKLPSIQFPKQAPQVLEYRINTKDGNLPVFPERLNVYSVIRSEPSIVALQNSRQVVKGGGFSQNEVKINDAVYQWSDQDGRRIEYNILTNNFKIASDYAGNSSVAELGPRFSSKQGAFDTSTDFLKKLSDDISDLDPEKTEITYLKIDNGRIAEAESQNEAQFLRIDLFQKNIDRYPIYYATPNESIMYIVFKGRGGFPEVSEANFAHYRIDKERISDYYIKTADQAFEDLKKGKAYIWSTNLPNKPVDITDVSLGYFVGPQSPNFFLPIVVFKGNGFLAYVQAIPDQLIEE